MLGCTDFSDFVFNEDPGFPLRQCRMFVPILLKSGSDFTQLPFDLTPKTTGRTRFRDYATSAALAHEPTHTDSEKHAFTAVTDAIAYPAIAGGVSTGTSFI
jgi:hypothetical protein